MIRIDRSLIVRTYVARQGQHENGQTKKKVFEEVEVKEGNDLRSNLKRRVKLEFTVNKDVELMDGEMSTSRGGS